MTEDRTLLRDYAVNGSEHAFTELVNRYLNLVYSAALRHTGGDEHQARDLCQTVFVDLARKAKALMHHKSIAGWLHTSLRYAASNARRAERRRSEREREAHDVDGILSNELEAQWEKILPILDEGIHSLREADRQAVLLRFFQNQSFATVGSALGVDEDAARKRVQRALERLRSFLKGRGVSVSRGLLAGTLANFAITAAPAGLAAALAKASLISAAVPAPALAFSILEFMSVTKAKIALTIIGAGLGTAVLIQTQSAAKLRKQNEELRAQLTMATPRAGEPVPDGTGKTLDLSQEQFNELMRLRGEVGILKRQLAGAEAAGEAAKRALNSAGHGLDNHDEAEQPQEQEMQKGIVKMGHAKAWMLALVSAAGDNNGFVPQFQQAQHFLPQALESAVHAGELAASAVDVNDATNHFEIIYQGRFDELAEPWKVIVLREKEPWQLQDGSWVKTYGFADGHSEVHKAVDGNFDRWEAERMILQQ